MTIFRWAPKVYQEPVASAARIFTEHGGFIRALINCHIQDKDQREDLFQDFFLSLVHHPVPSDVRDIKTFIFKALTNDIAETKKKTGPYQARVRRYAQRHEDAASAASGQDNPTKADAVALPCTDCPMAAEAAVEMKVKQSTVRRYVSIGIRRLRQMIKVKRRD